MPKIELHWAVIVILLTLGKGTKLVTNISESKTGRIRINYVSFYRLISGQSSLSLIMQVQGYF